VIGTIIAPAQKPGKARNWRSRNIASFVAPIPFIMKEEDEIAGL